MSASWSSPWTGPARRWRTSLTGKLVALRRMLRPMTDLRRPLLVLHVAWHPASGHGRVAEAIRAHFSRDRFATMTGRIGMSVAFRSVGTTDGAPPPAPVELATSDINVVVVLAGDGSGIECSRSP